MTGIPKLHDTSKGPAKTIDSIDSSQTLGGYVIFTYVYDSSYAISLCNNYVYVSRFTSRSFILHQQKAYFSKCKTEVRQRGNSQHRWDRPLLARNTSSHGCRKVETHAGSTRKKCKKCKLLHPAIEVMDTQKKSRIS